MLFVCLSWGMVFSQDPLSGVIQYQENNKTYPLIGASVFGKTPPLERLPMKRGLSGWKERRIQKY